MGRNYFVFRKTQTWPITQILMRVQRLNQTSLAAASSSCRRRLRLLLRLRRVVVHLASAATWPVRSWSWTGWGWQWCWAGSGWWEGTARWASAAAPPLAPRRPPAGSCRSARPGTWRSAQRSRGSEFAVGGVTGQRRGKLFVINIKFFHSAGGKNWNKKIDKYTLYTFSVHPCCLRLTPDCPFTERQLAEIWLATTSTIQHNTWKSTTTKWL